MKHLNVLREYLSDLGNGEPVRNPEALARCVEEIRKTLEASVKGRSPSISPSQTENKPRYFRHILDGTEGYNPDQFKPQARLKMLINSVAEHVIVFLMEEAGIEVKAPKNKMKVEILSPAGNTIKMSGSYDYTIDGEIVDAKVVNLENYNSKFKSSTSLANNDIFGYLLQGYLYEKGEGKEFAGWDVFCGNDWRMKHISAKNIKGDIEDKLHRFGERYDEALAAESIDELDLCYPLETHDYKGNRLDGVRLAWQCSRCPFRDSCFTNLREERKAHDVVRHWIGE